MVFWYGGWLRNPAPKELSRISIATPAAPNAAVHGAVAEVAGPAADRCLDRLGQEAKISGRITWRFQVIPKCESQSPIRIQNQLGEEDIPSDKPPTKNWLMVSTCFNPCRKVLVNLDNPPA